MEENNKDTQVVEENKVEETTEKTYTQDDINNSFNAGMSKAKKEFEKSEDYKNYQEWKKNNQNDSEKIAELETSNLNKDKEIADLKAQLTLKDSDVKPEFVGFVKSEVLSKVNDTTDFETALKNFKKDNSQYFGETVVKKVQSSPSLNGGDNQPQTTNSIMNDILRGVKNNS